MYSIFFADKNANRPMAVQKAAERNANVTARTADTDSYCKPTCTD